MSSHSEDSDGGLLGESSYEILTDSTLMTDEEDDGASSVASIDDDEDDNLDDNISSMANSTGSLSSRRADSPDPHPIPSFGGLDEQHLDGSGMTMRERDYEPEEIVFSEPEDPVGDQFEVSQKLSDFSETETAEIWKQLNDDDSPPPKMFSTVRQTMSRELLYPDEPFRVLYVGSTAAKDEIQHKLASALAAAISDSTSSSGSWDGIKSPRFNIIPVSSFGSRSTSPEVELVDSSGLDMTFDVCTIAKATKNDGQPETLTLWLNGNQSTSSLYVGNKVHLDNPGWKLPHLTVVYCSDDDNVQRRMTRVYARSFMARHAVPTLVIAQNSLYLKPSEPYALDTRSVHVCIESERGGVSKIEKALPIDLSTFLGISPRQLNRNLGCLTGLASAARSEIMAASALKTRAETNPLSRDVEKVPRDSRSSATTVREQKREELWKLILLGWLFICGVAGATFGIAYMKFANTAEMTVHTMPAMAAFTTPSVITTSSSILASSAVTSSAVRAQITIVTVSTLAPAVELKNQLLDAKMMTLNASDQFQAQVLGNNHVVIRPPQKYLLLRRPPALFVRVTRRQEDINGELSKMFEGVYTLHIANDDAWGRMNVSIWTKSKPIIKETLVIDFGTPWRQVTRRLMLLIEARRAGLEAIIEERRTEMQTLIDQAATDAKVIATELSETASHQAADIGAVVLGKARVYSEEVSTGISKLYQDALARTRKFAATHGTDEYVRKAQNRAKDLWLKGVVKATNKLKGKA